MFFRNTVMAVVAVLALGFGGPATAQSADCDQAISTVDMDTCLQRQYDLADAALNLAYKAAMQQMKSIDDNLPKAEKGAQDHLQLAQRAWIEVRRGTCFAEGFKWDGTARGLAVMSCMISETQAREAVLRGLAQYE